MVRYAKGETSALKRVYQDLAPGLLRRLVTLGVADQDAHALLPTVFLNLHRSRKDFRARADAKRWVEQIADNLVSPKESSKAGR